MKKVSRWSAFQLLQLLIFLVILLHRRRRRGSADPGNPSCQFPVLDRFLRFDPSGGMASPLDSAPPVMLPDTGRMG